MERRFPRTVGTLEEVFALVSEFASAEGLGGDVAFKIKLAIEEVFVNMIRHGTGESDILIRLGRDGNRLAVTLTDFDVEAFDPTKAEAYDTGQPLERRPIGRLGIHLVRKMVDDMIYRYEDRQSSVTLIKDLGKTDVQD